MRFVLSLLVIWPLTVINLICAFFFTWLFMKLKKDRRITYVANNWGHYQYRLLFTKLVVKGQHHIPREGGVILAANHRSYYDIFAINCSTTRHVRWVVKDALLRYPILGWVLRNIRSVGLDRANPREAAKLLLGTAKEIKGGDAIAIFPEGTRSKTNDLLPLKAGFFALAQKAGVPIVPVCIQGTEEVLPAKSLTFNFFKTVTIEYLEPLDPKTYGKDKQALSKDFESRMEACMKAS